ncbi:putative holin [Halopseudomonas pachastrellae]|nr:putative holin [Halopseudomonas pachastrellae]
MTDISSGTIAAAGLVGVSAASLIPGVDLEAVIGAFAGALFFMVMSKDLSWKARAANFLFSWIGGYFFAAEVVAREWATTSALPACAGRAVHRSVLREHHGVCADREGARLAIHYPWHR